MRAFLLALLLTTAAAAQQPDPLLARLQAIAQTHHGSVALYATNLTTHQSVALDADKPVQTASVIKLVILYEALEQLRANKVHLTDPITLPPAARVPGSGILTLLDSPPAAPLTLTFKDILTLMIVMSDNTATNLAIDHLSLADSMTLPPAARVPGSGILTLLDAPLTLTFKDILTLMIVMSDNTATNLAIDHLSLAAINAALPLPNTHLYKKVFTPIDPGTTLPDDFKQFGLGKTTPREITTVMQKLVTCDLGGPATPDDPALCKAALHMLQLQFTRTAIPRYLDRLPGYTDASIANKTGALNAVRNDVAAISTPAGLILISAFTYNNADQHWGADHEGELTIAKLARTILDAWSPAGLAPWPPPIALTK